MVDRRSLLVRSALLAAALGAWIGGAGAEQLGQPADKVVLTVTGEISVTNAAGVAHFDRAMLEDLGLTRLSTWTPWTEGEAEFEGVLARRLMQAVGARGTTLHATALNGYQCTIPIEDFDRYDVLLATRINGRPMRIRDKGPIWVVYPWSDHPELDDFLTREKAVWQLTALDVR